MSEKDWLSEALAARQRHVDDDGFTESVLQRLPSSTVRQSNHDWVILLSAALASAVVALQFPFAPFLDLITASASVPLIGGVFMVAAMGLALGADRLRQLFA